MSHKSKKYMKYLQSFLVWLCFIPAALLTGAFREYVLIKYLVTAPATAISVILLSILILLITWLLLPRFVPLNNKESYITGIIWMILTILFEFTSGIGTGVPMKELIAAYNPLSGNLWILVVLTTMLAPTIISRINKRYE